MYTNKFLVFCKFLLSKGGLGNAVWGRWWGRGPSWGGFGTQSLSFAYTRIYSRCCLITSLSTAVRPQAAVRVLYVSEREGVVPESTINSSGVVSPRIRRHLTGLSHSYPTALHYLFTLLFKKPLGSVSLLSFSRSNRFYF